MDLLKREVAPVLPEAWKLIDQEAKRVLELHLAGRKLVDFCGPYGFGHAAVNTGRIDLVSEEPVAGVKVGLRIVQPLVEVRTPIRLDLMEIDSVGRGSTSLDLDAVVRAAERVARVEDGAVFNGYARAGIRGIIASSPHPAIEVSDAGAWPRTVVLAAEVLRVAGVSGPYALALGPRAYDEVSAATEDGYPLHKRIERELIDGPIVWAPALDGAVLLSTRGGDFELSVGEDLAIGYAYHDKTMVELYLTESFTFRVLDPAAAVAIRFA